MKIRSLLTLAALLIPLLAASNLPAAEADAVNTNSVADKPDPATEAAMADLKDLVTKINGKIQSGKTTEADLGDNLKEFDALIAKNKDAKPEAKAQILSMKAQLYLEVLQDPEKALPIFKQIKTDFPTLQTKENVDEVITTVQAMVDRKKIRDALAPGKPFPDFQETDVTGNPLSISKYKGKVVLIDFWATWCPPCVAEIPDLQKAYDKFHDKGFEVVGISLDVEKGKLEQFVKQRKIAWPQFFDGKRWENKLAQKYGVDQTPTTYLIDKDGNIIKRLDPGDDIEAEIAKALKV